MEYTVETLWSAQGLTAAALNTNSVNCGNYKEATFFFFVSAISGTNPTIDLDIETSPDDATWVKEADVAQITGNVNRIHKLTENIAAYVRVVNPGMGGTGSPTATITVKVVFKDG